MITVSSCNGGFIAYLTRCPTIAAWGATTTEAHTKLQKVRKIVEREQQQDLDLIELRKALNEGK